MGIYAAYADRYFEAGYSVLPVDPENKSCLVKNWSEIFSHKMPDEETREKYINGYGRCDLGLACGKISGITVVDWDYSGKYARELETLVLEIIDPTPVMKQGVVGRWSKFYQYIDDVPIRHLKFGAQGLLDILSTGALTVLPPSPHKTAGQYVWLTPDTLLDVEAKDLPILTHEQIARLEDISKLGDDYFHNFRTRNDSRRDRIMGFIIKHSKIVKSIDELVEKAFAYDILINGPDAKGPFFQDKKYHKNTQPNLFCRAEVIRFTEWQKKKAAEKGVKFEVGCDQDHPTKGDGFYHVEVKENKDGEEKKKFIPDYYGLAKYLKEVEHLKSNDAFTYYYKDGYYHPLSQFGLKHIITDRTNQRAKPHEIDGFYKVIRSADFVSHDKFREPGGYLNLNNGVLNVETSELMPHSPELFFRYKLSHDFNPLMDSPKWFEFLNFVFEGKQDLISLSAEIFGYAMSGGYPWLHKAFLLYGEGRNGKSAFLDVLKHIIGFDNFCSIPVQNLNKPFSVVMADGKLANIIGETTAGELDSESFKSAVSGEELTAAQKGFPEYQMPFNAKIFFAANKLPYFRDTTAGNYEKLCIIPFERFIKVEERDPFITKKIYEEASGIINWALDGYRRLKRRGRLPNVSAVDANLEDYRLEIDSVYDWVNQHVEHDEGAKNDFLVKIYYEDYREFCTAQHRNPTSLIGFSRKVTGELVKKYGVIFTRSRDGARLIGPVKITAMRNAFI